MSLVDFIHRKSKPTSPQKGRFYWVDVNGETNIWFAPTDDEKDLILLNEDFNTVLDAWKTEVVETYAKKDEIPDVPTKVSDLENDVDYVTGTWIEEQNFAKKTDIPESTGLSDSDYDIIAEMVNSKSIELKWTEI